MSESNDAKVRRVATVWCNRSSTLPIPSRLKEIAEQLYEYRNPPSGDKAMMAKWKAFVDLLPEGSVDDDPEVMAAVEHYFYARSQVATGEYSSLNMKAMVLGYQMLKRAGLDLRHNKNNPTTAPSKLQQQWALLGAAQGEGDLESANALRKENKQQAVQPPRFRLPPNFTGALGGRRLDTIKY